jgi:hypothetical protein
LKRSGIKHYHDSCYDELKNKAKDGKTKMLKNCFKAVLIADKEYVRDRSKDEPTQRESDEGEEKDDDEDDDDDENEKDEDDDGADEDSNDESDSTKASSTAKKPKRKKKKRAAAIAASQQSDKKAKKPSFLQQQRTQINKMTPKQKDNFVESTKKTYDICKLISQDFNTTLTGKNSPNNRKAAQSIKRSKSINSNGSNDEDNDTPAVKKSKKQKTSSHSTASSNTTRKSDSKSIKSEFRKSTDLNVKVNLDLNHFKFIFSSFIYLFE